MPTIRQQATSYVRRWFKRSGWKAFPFQLDTWNGYLDGHDGLVHSPTGTGKTLAVFLGPVIEWLVANKSHLRNLQCREKDLLAAASQTNQTSPPHADGPSSIRSIPPTVKRSSIDRLNRTKHKRRRLPPLNAESKIQILWVTPLRALANDTLNNLGRAIDELGLPWQVEKRTGDTDAAVKGRQRKRFPEVLITTPESLSLMLSWPGNLERFSELKLLVVDEWHDLMGTKRGVQTELALARIRSIQPRVRTWGLSATIGNLEQALETLCGVGIARAARPQQLVRGTLTKKIQIDSIIPSDIERFPWAGHLGIRLASDVAQLVNRTQSSLIFTNTRSQTELWYKALLAKDKTLAGRIAVHHGSLSLAERRWVEQSLREGTLKCCVCTASLDLGVDFTVVDHVVQVGSPKGNARLLQRAGRSGHQPGVPSKITFVPTNAIELVELAAVRDSIHQRKIESRPPLQNPLDVLAQHVVTVALGSGFDADELFDEVKTTSAFADLSHEEWNWVLDFAERGGSALHAYPDFHRIKKVAGRFVVEDKKIARLHRLSIGTIVSDTSMHVKYLKGGKIGTVEESFVSRMDTGDKFMLGGKLLELVKIHNNTAYVRRGKGATTTIPRWMGGRMPLSSELSQAIRTKLEEASQGVLASKEMEAVEPLLDIQKSWSIIPARNQLLIERLRTRDGYHLFVYPFDGRLVHEGMAALCAWRLSQIAPISFSMAMNDYGFVLVSSSEAPLGDALTDGGPHSLFSVDNIERDIFESLNASEMSKRQFREIARVAGLIFDGYPGQRKNSRHLQASSNLFYDVFSQYDPENLLLKQARREVLEHQLERHRMVQVLQRIATSKIVIRDLTRPTPLAFPLIVDQLRDRVSSEKLSDRVARMVASLERAADSKLTVTPN